MYTVRAVNTNITHTHISIRALNSLCSVFLVCWLTCLYISICLHLWDGLLLKSYSLAVDGDEEEEDVDDDVDVGADDGAQPVVVPDEEDVFSNRSLYSSR